MKKHIITFVLLLFVVSNVAAQADNNTERVKIDADQNYLILSTKRIETMEKELDEVSAKGFRVLYGAPTATVDMALFLERADRGKETPYKYKILATSRIKTMEKELNEIASQGYRILPRTIIFKQGFVTAEMVTVMERAPDANLAYEYKLVYAGKETKLQEKIDAARPAGFAPVTMITLGENIVVLEKSTAAKQ